MGKQEVITLELYNLVILKVVKTSASVLQYENRSSLKLEQFGRVIKWYSHLGEQFGHFPRGEALCYYITTVILP